MFISIFGRLSGSWFQVCPYEVVSMLDRVTRMKHFRRVLLECDVSRQENGFVLLELVVFIRISQSFFLAVLHYKRVIEVLGVLCELYMCMNFENALELVGECACATLGDMCVFVPESRQGG